MDSGLGLDEGCDCPNVSMQENTVERWRWLTMKGSSSSMSMLELEELELEVELKLDELVLVATPLVLVVPKRVILFSL